MPQDDLPILTTLGQCLDHAQRISVTCDCSPRIAHVPPDRFLKLKNPPQDDTPVSALARYIKCSKCGRKDTVRTAPTGHTDTGIVPRVGFLDRPRAPEHDPYAGADWSKAPRDLRRRRPRGKVERSD